MPLWSSALPRPPVPGPRLVAFARETWAAMTQRPTHAGPLVSQALRATRWLGSKERKVAGDLLLGLVRHEHALRRIAADPIDAWIRLAQEGPPDLPDPPDALAVALSLPPWLAEEWSARLGEAAEQLPRILSERAPVALRRLRPAEVPVAHHAVGAHGVVLDVGANVDTWADRDAFLVQDLGSQAVVDAAFPGAGAHVLDLCAGAGGKALALAALGCRVQAWDPRRGALDELQRRALRAGLSVTVAPPTGPYDLVLVDAPCSGTGVLRRHPENRWKLQFPCDAQRALLARASTLAPEVVYATCALTQRENEEAVRAVDSLTLLDERTLWPTSGANDGFYVARLRSRQ